MRKTPCWRLDRKGGAESTTISQSQVTEQDPDSRKSQAECRRNRTVGHGAIGMVVPGITAPSTIHKLPDEGQLSSLARYLNQITYPPRLKGLACLRLDQRLSGGAC